MNIVNNLNGRNNIKLTYLSDTATRLARHTRSRRTTIFIVRNCSKVKIIIFGVISLSKLYRSEVMLYILSKITNPKSKIHFYYKKKYFYTYNIFRY